jgi:hypothetical protein
VRVGGQGFGSHRIGSEACACRWRERADIRGANVQLKAREAVSESQQRSDRNAAGLWGAEGRVTGWSYPAGAQAPQAWLSVGCGRQARSRSVSVGLLSGALCWMRFTRSA